MDIVRIFDTTLRDGEQSPGFSMSVPEKVRMARQLESLGENEVTTPKIGELVMETLRTLDHVAYVRYASVYRDFRSAGDFNEFVDTLKRETA